MLQKAPIEILCKAIKDANISHEAGSGHYVLESKNAAKTGRAADYPLLLLPEKLPVDGRGGFLLPGGVGEVNCPQLCFDLGVLPRLVQLHVHTGHLISADGQPPRFILQHPGEADCFALHVCWNANLMPPAGGMDSNFAKRHGAIWYRRFENLSDDEGTTYGNEDVWMLPATGFVKALCYSLAASTQQSIDAGDQAERDFQEHKAERRNEPEKTDLIERFNKVYGPDGTTLELKDDCVEITSPNGVDRIRYDAKCIPTLRRSVETAEHFDLMQDSGLLDAMIELTAIRTVLGLLF